MTTETLYPHEVVAKWLKGFPYILLTITVLIAGATILTGYTVASAINSAPPLGSTLIQPDAVLSCSSPSMMIVGSLVVVVGMCFAFNMLSRGELL